MHHARNMAIALAALASFAQPARADETPDPAATPLAVAPAHVAASPPEAASGAMPPGAMPPGAMPPGARPGFRGRGAYAPRRLSYTVDLSSSFGLGSTGTDGKLRGGYDYAISYLLNKRLRATYTHFTFPILPSGTRTGSVPIVAPNGRPLFAANLAQTGPDIRTTNLVDIASLAQVVPLGRVPLTVSAAYVSRSGSIPYAGYGDETVVVVNGRPQRVHLRTAQTEVVGLQLPLLDGAAFKLTAGISAATLVHTAGANQTNHPQVSDTLLAEWSPLRQLQVIGGPASVREYLPAEPYPLHLNLFRYGVSYLLPHNLFVQAFGSVGSSANAGRFGLVSLNCFSSACPRGAAPVPLLGGEHISTFQLKIGIGRPLVPSI